MSVGRSLAETPTWTVATVITTLVAVGFLIQRSINSCGKVEIYSFCFFFFFFGYLCMCKMGTVSYMRLVFLVVG